MVVLIMKEKGHRLDDYFKCYGDMTFRNICLFVDYHTAEDICQETFLRLAENLDCVNSRMVKAWLIVVSERLAKDYLKKGGKHAARIGLRLDEVDLADLSSDVENMVEELEESRKKGSILKRLRKEKPEWYDVLLMKYLEDMSDRMIGRKLGIREALVGQWRRRARLWLQDRYFSEYEERDS